MPPSARLGRIASCAALECLDANRMAFSEGHRMLSVSLLLFPFPFSKKIPPATAMWMVWEDETRRHGGTLVRKDAVLVRVQ